MRMISKIVEAICAVSFALAAAHTSFAGDYGSIEKKIEETKKRRRSALKGIVCEKDERKKLEKEIKEYDQNTRFIEVYSSLEKRSNLGSEVLKNGDKKLFFHIRNDSTDKRPKLLDYFELTYGYDVKSVVEQKYDLTLLIKELLSNGKNDHFIKTVRSEYVDAQGQTPKKKRKHRKSSSSQSSSSQSSLKPNTESQTPKGVVPAVDPRPVEEVDVFQPPSPEDSPRGTTANDDAPVKQGTQKANNNLIAAKKIEVPTLKFDQLKLKYEADYGKYFIAVSDLESFGFVIASKKGRRISKIKTDLVEIVNGINKNTNNVAMIDGIKRQYKPQLETLFSTGNSENKVLAELDIWWQKIAGFFGYKSECEQVLIKLNR